MTDHDPIPICRHCHRAIWRHVYGGEAIWRHFHGFMLCAPAALVLDVEAAAEPLLEESL